MIEVKTQDVHYDEGIGFFLTFLEEKLDGTRIPLDLTTLLPIRYTISRYDDFNNVDLTLPVGKTSVDGMIIQGSDNNELFILVNANNFQYPIKGIHTHQLEYALADGKRKLFFSEDINLKQRLNK